MVPGSHLLALPSTPTLSPAKTGFAVGHCDGARCGARALIRTLPSLRESPTPIRTPDSDTFKRPRMGTDAPAHVPGDDPTQRPNEPPSMSDPATTIRAACLCGTVRIDADLPASEAGHCHCGNCRRAHGAGVWTWVTFAADRVRVASGADSLTRYVTDTDATRGFCSVCGSTLTYESPRWPNTVDISYANLLDPVGIAPSRHSYADRSPEWLPILDDIPKFGGENGDAP